jgi:hypothetical protein
MADAVVLASAILAVGGTAVTGICKWRPSGSNGFMPKSLCDERSGAIQENIREIKLIQQEIFKEIKELRNSRNI